MRIRRQRPILGLVRQQAFAPLVGRSHRTGRLRCPSRSSPVASSLWRRRRHPGLAVLSLPLGAPPWLRHPLLAMAVATALASERWRLRHCEPWSLRPPDPPRPPGTPSQRRHRSRRGGDGLRLHRRRRRGQVGCGNRRRRPSVRRPGAGREGVRGRRPPRAASPSPPPAAAAGPPPPPPRKRPAPVRGRAATTAATAAAAAMAAAATRPAGGDRQ